MSERNGLVNRSNTWAPPHFCRISAVRSGFSLSPSLPPGNTLKVSPFPFFVSLYKGILSINLHQRNGRGWNRSWMMNITCAVFMNMEYAKNQHTRELISGDRL